MEPRICILIPTYNNHRTVVDVIERSLKHVHDVIVVNDGCTDGTEKVIAESGLDVTVLTHETNKGKGCALKTGFTYARKQGFTHVITLDADGQHYPEDIPVFLNMIKEYPDALILGSRNLSAQNMPGKNTFANKFSNFWFKVQTLQTVPDTQTGFRAYPLTNLPSFSVMTSRYEAELEMLVLSAWKGIKLIPVGINVYYPPKEERVSSFRPGADFARISVLNTVLCILAIFIGYPRILLSKLKK